MKVNRYLFIFVVSLLVLYFIFNSVNYLLLLNNDNIKLIKNCIKIVDSYTIWNPIKMKSLIQTKITNQYNDSDTVYLLHRSYNSMYIEWWIHNIGYYATKPFCFIKEINKINLRFKNVDFIGFVKK